MHPTLRSRARKLFGVQLYKNNARVLLSRILSILNSDWLQHACSVRGVYEWGFKHGYCSNKTAQSDTDVSMKLARK